MQLSFFPIVGLWVVSPSRATKPCKNVGFLGASHSQNLPPHIYNMIPTILAPIPSSVFVKHRNIFFYFVATSHYRSMVRCQSFKKRSISSFLVFMVGNLTMVVDKLLINSVKIIGIIQPNASLRRVFQNCPY